MRHDSFLNAVSFQPPNLCDRHPLKVYLSFVIKRLSFRAAPPA